MNAKRVKILKKAYHKLMKEQGASVSHSRDTWERFKAAYYDGKITASGELVQPKPKSFKTRRLISLTEVGIE